MSNSTKKSTTAKAQPKGPSLWQRTKNFVRSDRTRFVVGMVIFLMAAIVGLAFLSFLFTGKADQALLENLSWSKLTSVGNRITNWMGTFGAVVSELAINRWIGVSAFLFVAYFLHLGYRLIKNEPIRMMVLEFILVSLWAIWLSMALGFLLVRFYEDSFIYLGGAHGYDFTRLVAANLGWAGTFIVILGGFILLSLFTFKATIEMTRKVIDWPAHLNELRKERVAAAQRAAEEARAAGELEKTDEIAASEPIYASEPVAAQVMTEEDRNFEPLPPQNPEPLPTTEEDDDPGDPEAVAVPEQVVPDPTFTVEAGTTETVAKPVIDQPDYDPTSELPDFRFPGFELLRDYQNNDIPVDMEEQESNKNKIRQTLLDYGIEIQSINAMVGPTITLFEIVLESGTKISRVRSLSDEIAMSIASTSGIRIIAPIPGKSAIGIEVPNRDPQTVSMRSCIESKAFQESKMELPVALGKTITNEVFTFDLTKMPHLLVAGATGQGKSVGLNAIITSLLYKKHPAQLKLILIDPKQVEFSIYSKLENHYLAKLPAEDDPIITDVRKVVSTLNSVVLEMEDRYALLKDAGLRNIKEYNAKYIKHELNPAKHIVAPSGSKAGTNHKYLPYIVVVVDEYGDLIMTAGKEIELPIARIAQKARAVGIHMIIATQRPSAKIITGIIKANFPARIAFRVGQSIDSSIILDQTGAQNLIGRGDLLISTGNRFERVQCAFVDTPEVDKINRYIAAQPSYTHAFYLPDPPVEDGDGSNASEEVDLHQLDPLFDQAAELVVATGQGSTSMIQRKFAIGYTRAGRLMDQLEAAGIVGPYTGSKARDVLITSEMDLQNTLQQIKES